MFASLGAALGAVYAAVVMRWAPSPVRTFALGLLVAAVVYPVFALAGGAGWVWLGIELVGVALFGALCWRPLWNARAAGVLDVTERTGTTLVAAGWALHPLWDVALHASGAGALPDAPGAMHVPAWYPPACVTFDWVVASAVWMAVRRRQAARGGA